MSSSLSPDNSCYYSMNSFKFTNIFLLTWHPEQICFSTRAILGSFVIDFLYVKYYRPSPIGLEL